MTATHSPKLPTGMAVPSVGDLLEQSSWAIALRGVLGIVFGVVALIQPVATMVSLALLFAAYALADGVLSVIAAGRAAREHKGWGYLLLQGVAGVLAAAATMLWPGITVLAFVYLVAAWAILSAVLLIRVAYDAAPKEGRWWLILAGVLSLAYGALLVVAPVLGATAMTWWLGSYSIAFGVLLLLAALKLRAPGQTTADLTRVKQS